MIGLLVAIVEVFWEILLVVLAILGGILVALGNFVGFTIMFIGYGYEFAANCFRAGQQSALEQMSKMGKKKEETKE